MKLSAEIQLGVKRLCNPKLVNDDCFRAILQKAERSLNTLMDTTLKQTTENDELKSLTSRQDIIKEAYASLVTLYTIACQHNLDAASLSQYIQTLLLAETERLTQIVNNYETVRPGLVQICMTTNTSLANVVDVECQLEYCVQSSVFDDVSEFLYKVRLKTIDNGKTDYVNFVCNPQQLQELVNKLKDAVRHLDKIVSAA
ncbi:COMM domain-containing protein 3 [Adelges cooleyi]|uniref:COMM domain-containing protein 3 n=1 Tax=Adelges cooleyi TaxID=133065 RepID=UPI00217FF459|nr:COMM domain-containing protein 3 [Adelges cooleyi]